MRSAYLLRRHGWLSGCPSHAGIVSKRLNLSYNFFDHLVAPSFYSFFSDPCADTQFPSAGALNTQMGKIGDFRAIFDGNRHLLLKLLWDRPMVTMVR